MNRIVYFIMSSHSCHC